MGLVQVVQTHVSIDHSGEDGVLVTQLHLQVQVGQLVGAHLERVVRPQHPWDPDQSDNRWVGKEEKM